jgi:hypothetical protein
VYNATQKRDPKGVSTGGRWSAGGASSSSSSNSKQSDAGIQSEPTTTAPEPPGPSSVDEWRDSNGDGVTDASRVGVPADEVPPPPQIPRLPNLTPEERAVESAFADAFQKDPDGMARKYLEMVRADGKNKFEADDAKNLFEPWSGKGLTPDQRAEMRSTMNTPLHQTANAIAKRAFLMHLDEMSPEDRAKGLLVTVGGCGAGKGFALKTLAKSGMPEFDVKRYGATWDSAGDQNATENPWLLKEASARGIPVTYAYVSSDPQVSWADPKRGVVQRARNPDDGRMVDATVFADSYVIGAKNHAEFSTRNAKAASFVFVQNGSNIQRLPGVPETDLARKQTELREFALDTVRNLTDLPARIRRGATVGSRIWKKAA